MAKNEIRQAGVLQRHCPQEQRFFLGPNSQRHPAIVFHCYSWHGKAPFLYAFKVYNLKLKKSIIVIYLPNTKPPHAAAIRSLMGCFNV